MTEGCCSPFSDTAHNAAPISGGDLELTPGLQYRLFGRFPPPTACSLFPASPIVRCTTAGFPERVSGGYNESKYSKLAAPIQMQSRQHMAGGQGSWSWMNRCLEGFSFGRHRLRTFEETAAFPARTTRSASCAVFAHFVQHFPAQGANTRAVRAPCATWYCTRGPAQNKRAHELISEDAKLARRPAYAQVLHTCERTSGRNLACFDVRWAWIIGNQRGHRWAAVFEFSCP